jgi:hypothetical protein
MPSRSDAPVPVAFSTRNAVRKLKLGLSARICEELTYDDVVHLLLDDHDAIEQIEDTILAAIESFSAAKAEGMASLPIGDVLWFLGELKAAIEGDGEDVGD